MSKEYEILDLQISHDPCGTQSLITLSFVEKEKCKYCQKQIIAVKANSYFFVGNELVTMFRMLSDEIKQKLVEVK